MTAPEPGYGEELARAAIEATATMAAQARRLAAVEVDGYSPDRRVRVRVTAAGRVVALHLRDDALRRLDPTALADLVTRTVRRTQQQAREAYERQVAELVPPEVAASEQELHRIWRD